MSTSHFDLEQGISMITIPYQNSVSDDDDDDDIRSICFSDADEGSCYSTLYSTAGGSHDDDDDEGDVSESRRDSSASDCSVYVEIFKEENSLLKVHFDDDDDDDDDEVGEELKECRICHLSLGIGNGVIQLGCDCKNDLALAHSSCAERWFNIRGNRVCEICNSTAENVNVPMELELLMQHSSSAISTIVMTAQLVPPPPAERPDTTRSSVCRGHRLMNFILACVVFAFIVSWLFRFNVSS